MFHGSDAHGVYLYIEDKALAYLREWQKRKSIWPNIGYSLLDSIPKVFSANHKTNIFGFITVGNSGLQGWKGHKSNRMK